MKRIIKENGFVYLVEGDKKGFETYYNMGKDMDSPIWKDEVEEMNEKLENKSKKGNKTKKEEV